jgi:hypothetical protein
MSARSRRSGSSSDHSPSNRPPRRPREPGQQAGGGDLKLQSYQVGAMPLVNHLLERMRLREILAEHLPADDARTELATVSALLVLVRNVLLSRQPVYGVAEWAAEFALICSTCGPRTWPDCTMIGWAGRWTACSTV